MIFIGLDQALITGYAVYDSESEEFKDYGTKNFKKERGSSDGILFRRFSKWFGDFIFPWVTEHEVTLCYEIAHHRGEAATRLGMAFTTRIIEVCDKYRFDKNGKPTTLNEEFQYLGVRSNVMKKNFTGFGNATKEQMMQEASSWLDTPITDDNEADAIALVYYAMNTLGA